MPRAFTSAASTASPGVIILGWSTAPISDAVAYPGDGTVEIEGEKFNLEYDSGLVVLTHPQWSLLGIGATRADARDQILDEARALAKIMATDASASLSPQARRLRDFAKRVAR